jgi:peptide/nickel transport system permease protein
LIVLASLASAGAIVVEASLSFLGLGIPPPMPSWGSMLSDGRNVLRTAPWVAIVPGLMIMLVALALNVIGDTVRDVTDPRLRASRSATRR